MRIYICDDDIKITDSLASRIKSKKSDCEVSSYYKGRDLWEALQKETCDVVFLDIDMPDLSGLEIAAKISELSYSPLLVFVTSHDELVYDSLKFHPFGFIRKNYIESELEDILCDCIKEMGSQHSFFYFHTTQGEVKLAIDEILYFESDGNYLKLFTTKEEYRFRDTMTAIEKALTEKGFIRIHKGFLVNQMAVKVLGREEATLFNGVKIPIGRNYAEAVRKSLLRYML